MGRGVTPNCPLRAIWCRTSALAAAVGVIGLAAEGVAHASSLATKPLGTASALPVGDGRTIVAWRVGGDRVGFVDGNGRASTVGATDRCGASPELIAAGAGRLLFACPRAAEYPPPPDRYAVVLARTGAEREVHVSNPFFPSAYGERPTFDQLGASWLGGRVSFYRSAISYFVNWRTGRVVAGDRDPFGAARWLDLNFASLGRSLCRPARRLRLGDGRSIERRDRFRASPRVEGSWVLAGRGPGRAIGLGRCGRAPAPLRPGGPREAVLGGGLVSWRAPRGATSRQQTMRVRRLSDGRTWTVGRPTDSVVRAGRTVVLARAQRSGYRLLVARVPDPTRT